MVISELAELSLRYSEPKEEHLVKFYAEEIFSQERYEFLLENQFSNSAIVKIKLKQNKIAEAVSIIRSILAAHSKKRQEKAHSRISASFMMYTTLFSQQNLH